MRHGLNGKTAFWSKALRCVVILKATTLPLPLLLGTSSVTSSYLELAAWGWKLAQALHALPVYWRLLMPHVCSAGVGPGAMQDSHPAGQPQLPAGALPHAAAG
jgi:hypothetical protein